MTTRQKGETCWFHSILNGFYMSRGARVLLMKKAKQFKINKEVPLKSCPRVGSAMFWEYVYRHGRGAHFDQNKVIKNSGLRSKTNKTNFGTGLDLGRFLDLTFPSEYAWINSRIRSTGEFVHSKPVKMNKSPVKEPPQIIACSFPYANITLAPKTLLILGQKYKFSHAMINGGSIFQYTGHSIAVTRTKLYDPMTGSLRTISLDDNTLYKWYFKLYGTTETRFQNVLVYLKM
jgi:hypothetical protein